MYGSESEFGDGDLEVAAVLHSVAADESDRYLTPKEAEAMHCCI